MPSAECTVGSATATTTVVSREGRTRERYTRKRQTLCRATVREQANVIADKEVTTAEGSTALAARQASSSTDACRMSDAFIPEDHILTFVR